MKHLTVLFFLLAVTAFTSMIGAQDNVIDEIVWVVGDEPILRSEVETQRIQAQLEGVKFDGDPYCVIPEQLAVQKLFMHQGELDSIDIDENDIIATVDRQLNSNLSFYGSVEKLEEFAKMPISRLKEVLREKARAQSVMSRVQEKLVGDIKVTPSEVSQYYKSIPPDSLPTIPTEMEVEIITLDPQLSQQDLEAIKDRLRTFTDRVNAGESFATLAIMYSEDKGSARLGGELGFKGKAEFLPEFSNVAFSLTDPKKVSKIVETEYGYHIIQLIEKLGDRINCRHILLKPKITAVERNKALQRLDSIADLIRNQKISFSDAARFYSSDKETRNNSGLLVNPVTGTSHFKIDELPQDLNNVVYTMNVGEVSRPFTMRLESKDKEYCAIARLKSKSKAHKVSVSEDFQTLKQMVLEQKKGKIVDNWIREKQAKTYIKVSENWRNCAFKYPGWIK